MSAYSGSSKSMERGSGPLESLLKEMRERMQKEAFWTNGQRYSLEFKLQAIKESIADGAAVVAERHRVPRKSISKWKNELKRFIVKLGLDLDLSLLDAQLPQASGKKKRARPEASGGGKRNGNLRRGRVGEHSTDSEGYGGVKAERRSRSISSASSRSASRSPSPSKTPSVSPSKSISQDDNHSSSLSSRRGAHITKSPVGGATAQKRRKLSSQGGDANPGGKAWEDIELRAKLLLALISLLFRL